MKTLDNDVRTLYIVFNLNRKGDSSNAHQAVIDRKNCIYDPYRLCVRSSGESPEVTFRTSLSCLICRLSVTDKRFFMSGNKSIKEEIIMMNENMENEIMELSEDMLEQVSGGKQIVLKITVSEANVRSGPGTDFSINGRLHKGDKVIYLSDKKRDKKGMLWVYVSNGRLNGWIRTDLVAKAG